MESIEQKRDRYINLVNQFISVQELITKSKRIKDKTGECMLSGSSFGVLCKQRDSLRQEIDELEFELLNPELSEQLQ